MKVIPPLLLLGISEIKLSTVRSVSTPVGFVSDVPELLSSGRMSDRKWNWPESLAGFRQPLPLPTHAKPCQLLARPRPPWEKQSLTSSGKCGLGLHFPCFGSHALYVLWRHADVTPLHLPALKQQIKHVECLVKVGMDTSDALRWEGANNSRG